MISYVTVSNADIVCHFLSFFFKDQIDKSSSKSTDNNLNQCSSTNKDGNDQCEVPLQHEELVATDLKSFTYDELNNYGNMYGELNKFRNDTWFSDLNKVTVYNGWIHKTRYSPSEENTRLPVAIKGLDGYECADRVKYPIYLKFDMQTRICCMYFLFYFYGIKYAVVEHDHF